MNLAIKVSTAKVQIDNFVQQIKEKDLELWKQKEQSSLSQAFIALCQQQFSQINSSRSGQYRLDTRTVSTKNTATPQSISSGWKRCPIDEGSGQLDGEDSQWRPLSSLD